MVLKGKKMEKREKVLIVHNFYQIPGGEDIVVANEKQMLEANGHEVILYTRHNSELKSFSKFQKILLPFSTIFNLKTYHDIKKIIREEKIKIVHVHNTLNLISPSVYYAALHSHIPVVQTIHNFRLLCPGATFFKNGHVCEECLNKGLICSIKNKCYRGSRIQTLACVVSTYIHRCMNIYGKLNYICLTEFNKEKLLCLKQIKEENIYIKPNFVTSAKVVVPYKDRANQIVYVGRLEEIKGMDVLLEAWKIMGKDAPKLLMCGTGPLEEWCRTYIDENCLNNVEMLGFLPNEQVRAIVGNSKALVLPTQVYEGFPMTIAEAYAAGTPVIGSDLGNTGSLIQNGKNGWKFQPKSVEQLVESVEKIQRTFEGLDEESINRYSAEKNYEQLRNIYEACCNHY